MASGDNPKNIARIYDRYNSGSTLSIARNTLRDQTKRLLASVTCGSLEPQQIVDNTATGTLSAAVQIDVGSINSDNQVISNLEGNLVYNNAGDSLVLEFTNAIMLRNNSLYDNVGYDVINQCALDMDATQNWWCADTTGEMDALPYPPDISSIYDSHDDESRGTVDYRDWLTLLEAPAPPALDPVTTPTNAATQVLSGTKPADTSVWMNNAEIVPASPDTTWSYETTLQEDENSILLYRKTAQGLASEPVSDEILRDTTPSMVFDSYPGDGESVSRAVEAVEIIIVEFLTEIDETATLAGPPLSKRRRGR